MSVSQSGATRRRVDVLITGGGSVFLFRLLTTEARSWVRASVSQDRMMFGDGLVVEHRYASALVEGMQNDGLVLDVEAH